jgi:tetratricopeptide (TPR) repeat protein
MAADLERFLEDRPIQARPASAAERTWRWCRRNPVGGALILALVFGLIGTCGAMLHARDERDRALRAEQDVRELLAESHAQGAILALQRGAWRPALVKLDEALAAGHGDPVRLRLHKVRAWCAVHEISNAVRELERLKSRSDLGDLEGLVRLWQADLKLGFGQDGAALSLVRQALQLGLPPADSEYARGLLAETSTEAVRHFRQAVDLDAFHHRANGMLGLVLLFLGESGEARERITLAQRLFPDDPTFRLLLALYHARDDRVAEANRELESARPYLGQSQIAAARQLIEAVRQVRFLEGALVGDPGQSNLTAVVRFVTLIGTMGQAVGALQADSGGTGRNLLLPLPPVLGPPSQVVPHLPKALLRGDQRTAIDELTKATAIHPDGMLLLLQGTLLANSDRIAEAEQVFREAAARPSFVPIRRAALYAATSCEWLLAREEGNAAAETMRTKALESARQLVACGNLSPDIAALVTTVAIDAGDLNLARTVLTEWERQSPGDLRAARRRMKVEYNSEAFGPAIVAADRILCRRPDDADAQRIRADAIRRLGR